MYIKQKKEPHLIKRTIFYSFVSHSLENSRLNKKSLCSFMEIFCQSINFRTCRPSCSKFTPTKLLIKKDTQIILFESLKHYDEINGLVRYRLCSCYKTMTTPFKILTCTKHKAR